MKWKYIKESNEWHKDNYVIRMIENAVFRYIILKDNKYIGQERDIESAKKLVKNCYI